MSIQVWVIGADSSNDRGPDSVAAAVFVLDLEGVCQNFIS